VESYRLQFKPSARKELEGVGAKTDRIRIVRRIEALAGQPRPPDCQKLGGTDGCYRVRQGPYRIVYAVDDKARAVTVFKIGHRKDVYR
jgi:mRNA interferase RelE/StbE